MSGEIPIIRGLGDCARAACPAGAVIDTAILARRIRPPIKKLSGTIIAACLRVLNI